MGRNEIPIPRVTLPDDWEPDEITCALVPCPDDPQYLAILAGLIDQLRQSRTFERDPTKTGAATVARTWSAALDSRPIIFIECEGEMPYALRDDPDDPCAVQQSFDGQATWVHAFFKGCDDVTELPTPNTEAAQGAGNYINNLFVHIAQMLDDAANEAEFTTNYCDWLTEIGVQLSPGEYTDCNEAAAGHWFAWNAATGPEKTEALDPCTYTGAFEELQSCFDGAGVIDWLNCASDTLISWLGTWSSSLINNLNQAAAYIVGDTAQNAADYDFAGGGAGFGSGCSGGEFGCTEFAETTGGYTLAGPYGKWINGVGWKGTLRPDDHYEVHISKTGGFPTADAAEVRVNWEPTGNGKYIRITVNGVVNFEGNGGNAGFRTAIALMGTEPVTSIDIFVSQNNLNSSLRIIRVCIEPVIP